MSLLLAFNLIAVPLAGLTGWLLGMLYEAYHYPHGTTTSTHRVETTCIHCRRMRKFTRRGIYR